MKQLSVLLVVGLTAACGGLADETMATTPARGTDAGPPKTDAAAALRGALCPSLGVQRRDQIVLSSVTGSYGAAQDLAFYDADGHKHASVTFGEERRDPEKGIYISDIAICTENDTILAERESDGAALFDRQGVLLERTHNRTETEAMLGRRKLFAPCTYRGITVADGNWTTYGGETESVVPVIGYRFDRSEFGWFDPTRNSVARIAELAGAPPQWIDEAFINVTADATGAFVSRFTPHGSTRLALPGYAGEPHVGIVRTEGEWVLAGSYEAKRYWLVNSRRGVATALGRGSPKGLNAFIPSGSADAPFQFAGEGGRVMGVFRDSYKAEVWTSDNGVDNWAPLGPSIADVSEIYVDGHAGTYFINASSDQPISPGLWAKPTPANTRLGAQAHLVRPDTGVSYTIQSRSLPQLTRDGLCALTSSLGEGADRHTVLDMTGGVPFDLGYEAPARFTWVE